MRSTRKSLTALMIMLSAVLLAFSGCSRPDGRQAEAGKKTIMVKGSDTMVHLVSTWAENFMKQSQTVQVSVTGGGSGTGIAALINGTADICAASREMKQEEIDQARQRSVEPKEIAVALDGIAVVVNPSNPVAALTMEQLEKIYTGQYDNWSQVGGQNAPIVLLSRESSSGTYVFFQEHVLKKKDYAPSARLMPATSAIVQSVAADAQAIGYVGLGYAAEAGSQVRMVPVKADDASPAVEPSETTVKSGEYSISRALYYYTNGEPQGSTKEFVDYCLGAEGQKIVRETGYITIN